MEQRLEVTLTHPAAAFAAMIALEGMSEASPHADGVLVSLTVPERNGAIMEAASRLYRAGVSANDIVVRSPALAAAGSY
jgi:ABC-2 type transport system ATP-binding protein